ncbi:MAG TPA: branched-chain amino acid ABC transporter permease [Candidatus Bathyarchaeia archaeon]|nr:branched-chain amino acid ABC transporter permease [Candidatus Bathyarchaeia archaeon]
MRFFLALLVDGALAGVVYALVALAFVIVYKASRIINFSLGEWVMLGARLTALGLHQFAWGLAGAAGGACAGMVGLAIVWNRIVLRRLVGRPLIALIMVTLGLGMVMRGGSSLAFRGVPGTIPLPLAGESLDMWGVPVAPENLLAAVAAGVLITAVTWLFQRTRIGLALRAMADDQEAAMAAGVDLDRYLSITWALAGVVSVLGGILWTAASGGGFGLILLGLRVFPIVVIGGLDSLAGCIVGAMGIGILESLAGGYLDPVLGGGFSSVTSYLALIVMLYARPTGLLGRPVVERV